MFAWVSTRRMFAGRLLRSLGRTAVVVVLAAFLLGSLSGCCTIGVGPCTLADKFTLVGANDLNACGGDEQSHPVAIRFFALKSAQKFQDSTFEDIWSDAGQTLGGDLIGDPEKVFVQPGGTEIVSLVRADGVTAIGVLANFCDRTDDSVRRQVFSLGKRGIKKTLTLRGINLTTD